MVSKMPWSFVLELMVFYALLLRLELEILPLEVLDVLINGAWRTRTLTIHMMIPLLEVAVLF
jgi:hypothetical protein